MKNATSLNRYWEQQLELMRTMPQAVHARADDSIHGLRAAGRRLKATLQVYRPLLRRQLSTEVIDSLDWYNAVLGQARDAEVIHQAVAAHLRTVRAARPVLAAIDSERRRTAHLADKMVVSTRADRVVGLVDELVSDPWRGGKVPANEAVQKRLRWAERRVANVWQAGPRNGETVIDWQHRLRRRAKVARFAAEALARATPEAGETASAYAKLSTVMGVIQDTAIINRTLRVWPRVLVGDLIDSRDKLAEQAVSELPVVLAAAVPAELLK